MKEAVRNFERTKILVVGLGVTGSACARVLPKLGAQMWVTDSREDLSKLGDAIDTVESLGAKFVRLKEAANLQPDIVIVSPGLSMDDPKLAVLKNGGGEWIAEIEMGYRICKGRIAAVTGTNGKSTCVTLLGEILKRRFDDVRVSGNIGDAFIEAAADSTDNTVHVIEISSYQLEGCKTFAPDAGIVLNVREDHLTRHPTIEEYAAAKAILLKEMKPGSLAVLYRDDPLVSAMAEGTKADVAYFSTSNDLEEGAFLEDGVLVVRTGGADKEICRVADMELKGNHNSQNVLAASLVADRFGVSLGDAGEVARGFTGLEHRIEYVDTVDGIECVNDSKATNVDAAIAALRTYEGREITIILGGDDKGFKYEELYEEIRNCGAKAIVMGPGLARVAEEIKEFGGIRCFRAPDMQDAVEEGLEVTPKGGVLLLAPSTSSFDLYRNFMERGRDFKHEIKTRKAGA